MTGNILAPLFFTLLFPITLAQADSKIIEPGKTETIWSGGLVSGEVCLDADTNEVEYWFIRNGRNSARKTLKGEGCIVLSPKLYQELRVHNLQSWPISVDVWDDVKADPLVSFIVSFEELGEAFGDTLENIRKEAERALNIRVGNGQKGAGCWLVDTEPQLGTDIDDIDWVQWETDEYLSPTTKYGRNMRLSGFTARLYADGRYEFSSDLIWNRSKHAKWGSSFRFDVGNGEVDGKHDRLEGLGFSVRFPNLGKGRSTKPTSKSTIKTIGEKFQQMDTAARPYVCLYADRT